MHITSTPIDQQVAEEVKTHANGGTVRFQQIIKGWSGSGFDSSWRMAEATFFESAQCATLSFDCMNTKNSRNLKGGLGSLALDRASAIKLARALVPQEIAAAIDAAAAAAATPASTEAPAKINAREKAAAIADWLGWQDEDMAFNLRSVADAERLYDYWQARGDTLPEMADEEMTLEPTDPDYVDVRAHRIAALGYDPLP